MTRDNQIKFMGYRDDDGRIGGILLRAKAMAADGVLNQPTVDAFVDEIESLLPDREKSYAVDEYRECMEVLIDPIKKQARDERWRKQAEQSRWAKGILEANRKIWERHIREDELAQSASARADDSRVASASRVALRGSPASTVVGYEQVGAL